MFCKFIYIIFFKIPHISDIVWYLSSYTVSCSCIFWLKIASLWWDSPWTTYAGERMLFHVGNSGELFPLGAVLTGENCVNCWFGAICKSSVGDCVLRCSLFSILLPQALIRSCFRVSAWCSVTSVVSDSLWLWTEPTRLPCAWDSPGKSTGVGCHALFQGIFPIQRSNPCFLHWLVDYLPLSHLRSPYQLCNLGQIIKHP